MEDEERKEIRRDGEKERRNLFIIKTKKKARFIITKRKKKQGEIQKSKDLRKDHEMQSHVTLCYNENENCKMKLKKKKKKMKQQKS